MGTSLLGEAAAGMTGSSTSIGVGNVEIGSFLILTPTGNLEVRFRFKLAERKAPLLADGEDSSPTATFMVFGSNFIFVFATASSVPAPLLGVTGPLPMAPLPGSVTMAALLGDSLPAMAPLLGLTDLLPVGTLPGARGSSAPLLGVRDLFPLGWEEDGDFFFLCFTCS